MYCAYYCMDGSIHPCPTNLQWLILFVLLYLKEHGQISLNLLLHCLPTQKAILLYEQVLCLACVSQSY